MRTPSVRRRWPVVRTLSLVLLAAVASAGNTHRFLTDSIEIHGFVSQGVLASSDNNYLNNSSKVDLAFTEAGVNASIELSPSLRIGAQLFARELGELGDFQPVLDWAFVDWHASDTLGLRLGRFKLPYGLYNETADIDAVRTFVLLPQSVYNLELRDFLVNTNGVAVYGSHSIGAAGSLDYQGHVGWTYFSTEGSVARLFNSLGQGAYTVSGLREAVVTGARVQWNPPVDGLRTAGTFNRYRDGRFELTTTPQLQATGAPPHTAFDIDYFDMIVGSAEYARGLWLFAAEYALWQGTFDNPMFGVQADQERFYMQTSRRLQDQLEIGAYYSVLHDQRSDRDGSEQPVPHHAYQRDLALAVRLDLDKHWILKLEGHAIDGTASVLSIDNPTGLTKSWALFAIKLSYSF